ncbi:MAG TPA: DinB family protein [Candidatus Aquilonibacter sp.]|nr:DinB family protein [Candidatus Aquilonibacter sp.]
MTNVAAVVEKTSTTPLAAEFREEARTTRRVLERMPIDKLNWKPTAKSMSLGQLALHIASVPGRTVSMFEKTEHEVDPNAFRFEEAKSAEEILAVFDQSAEDAGAFLDSLSDEELRAAWTLKANGRTLFTKSRQDVIRMIMLSHIYHHRGQLSVYLRLLDIPVPSIYGPSGDENPFA